MPNKPVYITSDVHLGAISADRADAFHTWLAHAAEAASEIILNGDLFDFWYEFRRGIPTGYERTLDLLREVTDSGVPVMLMGGNHDWWGGDYLRQEIGLDFRQHPVTLDLAGHTVFLAHGDGLGTGDLAYLFLRLILRGRLTRWSFAQVGPKLGGWVARRVSKTEHRTSAPTDGERERSEALQSWAVEKLARDPSIDLVVLGHTHLPVLLETHEGRYYLNAGDWVRSNSYAILQEGSPPRLLRWDGGPTPVETGGA